jgi:hypothetical protein
MIFSSILKKLIYLDAATVPSQTINTEPSLAQITNPAASSVRLLSKYILS